MNPGQDLINSCVGVILAGGESRRFGGNKALALWQGKPLIAYVAGTLKACFARCLLVTNTPEAYAFLGWTTVPDQRPGLGPLAGIQAALAAINEPRVFVAACDMPFLSRDLIRLLCALAPGYDVVAPCPAQGPEPLAAVYARDCLAVIERHLAVGNRQISALFPEVRTRFVAEDELLAVHADRRTFANINRPEDLAGLGEMA